jgi:transcriptional regulator GlxA family with amidase domain
VRSSGGRVSVAELARAADLSTRQLERRFHERVGFAPKLFARLVRFQRALSLLRAGGASLGEVAAACGYYDQPHLVRDFRRFAHESPARFLRVEHELTGHFVDAAPGADVASFQDDPGQRH